VLCGPTATGKTALAVTLALRFDGEIVGADSRQVYRHMDVGTAKPSPQERALVPHHLIDVAEPDEPFSLADYGRLARAAIAAIAARGRLPLLVGGTGLYIRAVVRGFDLAPGAPPQAGLRRSLEEDAAREGPAALHARLAALDPAGAARIDPRNVRRVVRALEVTLATGRPFSRASGQAAQAPYDALLVGLDGPRDLLYRRADARVDTMMAGGLLHEVEALRARGYDPCSPALTGLGYRELGAYLDGTLDLAAAVQATKYATHRYIRRQLIWFRREEDIHWFSIDDPQLPESVSRLVAPWRRLPAP
jgi:tRNA dimethylallyltransferase